MGGGRDVQTKFPERANIFLVLLSRRLGPTCTGGRLFAWETEKTTWKEKWMPPHTGWEFWIAFWDEKFVLVSTLL